METPKYPDTNHFFMPSVNRVRLFSKCKNILQKNSTFKVKIPMQRCFLDSQMPKRSEAVRRVESEREGKSRFGQTGVSQ